MLADPLTIQMATHSTRRAMGETQPERAPRPRRATARVLHAIALRLDPALLKQPQLG